MVEINKKILLILFVFGLVAVILTSGCIKIESREKQEEPVKCIGEGRSMSGEPPLGKTSPRCCEGLTPIKHITRGDKKWFTLAGASFCTKCGDGVCKEPENIKNCPEDCSSYILHEWGVLLKDSIRTSPLQRVVARALKPIIYIYSDNDFDLSLSVDFENGEAMEVWPYIPTGKKISWDNFEISSDCETTPFPRDRGDMKEIYELGNYVVDTANCITFKNTTSKILFYNGKIDFGNIITGYYVDSGTVKQITLTNNLEQDISDIYINYKIPPSFQGIPIVYVVEEGSEPEPVPILNVTLGIFKINELKAGETKTWNMTTKKYDLYNLPIFWKNQGKEFKQKLINVGLYTDEANKFMKAWEDTFFGIQTRYVSNIDYKNGMNIIFILPEEKYNNLFNLETSIKPQEIRRVGVVFSSIEESVPVTTATGSTGISIEFEENCESYTNQINIYCNPFLSTYNKELCSKAEENYKEKDCCYSES